MHAELSLAEISPAVRHASTVPGNVSAEEPWRNHQCILGYSSSREPPRSSVLDVHLEKLDVLQHGALKYISGSVPEDRGGEIREIRNLPRLQEVTSTGQ